MMLDYSYMGLMLPGLLLGLYAQFRLNSTYRRYTQVPSERGLTGAQAARAILDQAGLAQVGVSEIGGKLTDHFDPTKHGLFLSSANFHGDSLAALGVAAHEAGHALQQQAAYGPFRLRTLLVPATNIASTAVYGILLLSFILGWLKLIPIAVGCFAVITLFQLITLPVEYDASRRARQALERLGLISGREAQGVRQVLNAAALTYVAALVASIMELLRYVLIARSVQED